MKTSIIPKLKNSLLIIILIFLVSACNKDMDESTKKSPIYSLEDQNSNLELLGQAFSMSIAENPEFRELIKKEALKKFDGQYDVLYCVIENNKIGNTTVKELLSSNFKKITNINFDKAVNSIHYLQFSVPIKIDEWNTNSTIPLLAIVPVNVNDQTTKELIAFNSKQEKVTISAKNKPTETILAISKGERIDKYGKLKVNEDGLVVDEKFRISIQQAIEKTKLAKSKSLKSSLINVVSDEEFTKISEDIKAQKTAELKQEENCQKFIAQHPRGLLKSTVANNIDLKGFSNQPRTITMYWENPTTLGLQYRIYYYGPNGGSPVLAMATPSTRESVTLPVAGVYNFWIEGWYYNTLQTVSNYLTIHASDRKEGSIEYVNRIIVSESRISNLEGWYAQDLEFGIKIAMTGAGAISVPINRGFQMNVNCSIWGGASTTDKSGQWNLFNWYRSNNITYTYDNVIYTGCNTVYTISWYEEDDNDADTKLNVAKKIVGFVGSYFGVSPAVTEGVMEIGKIAFDIDSNDETISSYDVYWWDPQKNRVNVAWGFAVEHSYL